MKLLIMAALIFTFTACEKEIRAQENKQKEQGQWNNPETKPESDISAKTKKVLRKIGRKSMDETCKYTDDKATCEKQKLEHKRAQIADEKDTKRRQEAKLKEEEKELKEQVDKSEKL